jgi:hypothetical protein
MTRLLRALVDYVIGTLYLIPVYVLAGLIKLSIWRKKFCRWVERKQKNGTRNL